MEETRQDDNQPEERHDSHCTTLPWKGCGCLGESLPSFRGQALTIVQSLNGANRILFFFPQNCDGSMTCLVRDRMGPVPPPTTTPLIRSARIFRPLRAPSFFFH